MKAPIPLPVQPENLPAVDQRILDAVLTEHANSTGTMALTLRRLGWSPMQSAYVEQEWPWSWVARAVVHGRQRLGQYPVDPALVAAEIEKTPAAILRAEERAYEADHGPTPPPRPPMTGLPAHLRDPFGHADRAREESQGETL